MSRSYDIDHTKQALIDALQDAIARLEDWIGSDCECDNTHEAVGSQCCLCEYRKTIEEAEEADELE